MKEIKIGNKDCFCSGTGCGYCSDNVSYGGTENVKKSNEEKDERD